MDKKLEYESDEIASEDEEMNLEEIPAFTPQEGDVERLLEIVQNPPAEEIVEEKKKLPKGLLIKANSESIKRGATPAHSDKNRGVGVTRSSHAESKKAKKTAKKSRKINRGK